MNDFNVFKCWLLEKVSQKTGEAYYCFTTNKTRNVIGTVLGLEKGIKANYSKWVPGSQANTEPYHTIFCTGMLDEHYRKACKANGGSDVFYMYVADDDESDVRILTGQEHKEAQQSETQSESIQLSAE